MSIFWKFPRETGTMSLLNQAKSHPEIDTEPTKIVTIRQAKVVINITKSVRFFTNKNF